MLFHHDRTERLRDVAERLYRATSPSAALLYEILGAAEPACIAKQDRARTRIAQFIECGAWTEAALDLIDLCCPRWQLSRLMYDNGEWYCRLSPQRELPDWLGVAIETRHECIAMALLKGVLEAALQEAGSDDPPASMHPAGPKARKQAEMVSMVFEVAR